MSMKTQKTQNVAAEMIIREMPADKLAKSMPCKELGVVRTTIRLSEMTWACLEQLSTEYSLSQKSGIELAVQFLQANLPELLGTSTAAANVIKLLRSNSPASASDQRGVRKTVVLSKECTNNIERVMETLRKEYNATDLSRDELFDGAIILYQAVIRSEQKKVSATYSKALEVIARVGAEIEEADKQLRVILPDDDPILWRIGRAAVTMDSLEGAIKSYLKNGTPVDPDEV